MDRGLLTASGWKQIDAHVRRHDAVSALYLCTKRRVEMLRNQFSEFPFVCLKSRKALFTRIKPKSESDFMFLGIQN